MINLFRDEIECSGCTACYSICPVLAISMAQDQEGFFYPEIDHELCIACGLCIDVCPFHQAFGIQQNYSQSAVYAAKNLSEEVRIASTSGGMFTALSDYFLDNGGVVYGASYLNHYQVSHQRCVNQSERNKARESKYVQSDLTGILIKIKKDLDSNIKVLFTGTPCQTAGVYNFLKFTKTNIGNLVLCDIICHGVPSALLFKKYIDLVETHYGSSIKYYTFRSKKISWKGVNVSATFENCTTISNTQLLQSFPNLYFNGLIIRPSCHACVFANATRPSDITIGDFWGIENVKPDFYDNLGVSLILINSAKGENLFHNIKNLLAVEPSSLEECLPGQINLQHPSRPSSKREQFWKDYQKLGFDHVIKKYGGYRVLDKIKKIIKQLLQYS